LITGGLRIGISARLTKQALALYGDIEVNEIEELWHGLTLPYTDLFAWLEKRADKPVSTMQAPFRPVMLAHPINAAKDFNTLDHADFIAEWKWDGIRGQLIRRAGDVFLWTRGEELVTDRYPELSAVAGSLPDGVVIDGEILAWDDDGVMPFSVLQKRIGRSKVSKNILKEAPVGFLAYDLLEEDDADIRQLPLAERRRRLSILVRDVGPPLMISATIEAETWEELAALRKEARGRRVEGLMLKRRNSAYQTGRKRGDWWKWKVDPLSIDAVLINAQAGSGRRANLFTDYTFAVWKGDELVPIAKAYSGLSDKEIATLDRWIRRHTTERFGPVRYVEPHHVFEIAFEGINESKRHKSGVALRFPRIARWRTDKAPADADKLEQVKTLLDL